VDVTRVDYSDYVIELTNRRLGPTQQLALSKEVVATMLREVAAAARPVASARWEHELVCWLDDSASRPGSLDVGDLAWTPEHFEAQRKFVVDAIHRALDTSSCEPVMRRWLVMIAAHPRESVKAGRRWPMVVSAV
jgi:hypothetical protein